LVLEEITSSDEELGTPTTSYTHDQEFVPEYDRVPQRFTQSELNDLTRDLYLPKTSAELIGSRHKNKNLLKTGVSFVWYRYREKELKPFFSEKNNFVICNNVNDLLRFFEFEHDPSNWRIFIDSSKRSLKAVLIHNGSKYASIPVAHSVHHKKTYEIIKNLFILIKYEEHKRRICGDFKVIGMSLRQQAGYTKLPCFLCEWNS